MQMVIYHKAVNYLKKEGCVMFKVIKVMILSFFYLSLSLHAQSELEKGMKNSEKKKRIILKEVEKTKAKQARKRYLEKKREEKK